MEKPGKPQWKGIGFALLATVLWSANFIIARGLHAQINPIALSFARWGFASCILAPFAWKALRENWHLVKQNIWLFSASALMGVSLFNTFIYIAGKSVPAMNLALIGTTASPIFVLVLTALFTREKPSLLQWGGAMLCICGILFLLTRGDLSALGELRFSGGDLWIFAAGLSFAIYTLLVRRKPHGMPAKAFLMVNFGLGTLFLLPAFLIETYYKGLPDFTATVLFSVLYLAIGASVFAFLLWNLAIHRLGPPRTALFGNLIPLFATVEAALFLEEQVTPVIMVSFIFILAGLALANAQVLQRRPG